MCRSSDEGGRRESRFNRPVLGSDRTPVGCMDAGRSDDEVLYRRASAFRYCSDIERRG